MANILDYNNLLNNNQATLANIVKLFPSAEILPSNPVIQQPTQPTQTQQQPQQSNNNGMSVREQMQKGLIKWDDNLLAQSEAGNNGGGNSQPQVNYDEMYKPIFGAYDQTEATLRNIDLPNQISKVNNDATNLQTVLDQQKTQGLADIQTNQRSLDKQKESAFSEAVRMYNSLTQNANVRFGRNSSTGAAASDILNQQLLRNEGSIQSSYDENFQKLREYQGQVMKRFDDERLRMDRDKNQAISDINNNFQKTLAAIAVQRAQTETEKSSRKVLALEQATARTQALQDGFKTQEKALDVWKQQQQYLIDKGLANLQQNAYTTPQNAITTPQATAIGQSTPTGIQPVQQQQKKNYIDDFMDWINPFN